MKYIFLLLCKFGFHISNATLLTKGFVDTGAKAGADVVDPERHCSGKDV